MTDTVTILAQKRNRLHSHRLYMENITINREDELFIWVLKADLACIVYHQSQAVMAAEADDLRVISKEALGSSWSILSAILGHKYHQNHPEKNLQPKTEFDYVCVFPYVYAPSWLSGMCVLGLFCFFLFLFSIVHHTCHNWLSIFQTVWKKSTLISTGNKNVPSISFIHRAYQNYKI